MPMMSASIRAARSSATGVGIALLIWADWWAAAVRRWAAASGWVSIERRTARVVVGSRSRREEIRSLLRAAATSPIRLREIRSEVVHQTLDPEVVIPEYEAHG